MSIFDSIRDLKKRRATLISLLESIGLRPEVIPHMKEGGYYHYNAIRVPSMNEFVSKSSDIEAIKEFSEIVSQELSADTTDIFSEIICPNKFLSIKHNYDGLSRKSKCEMIARSCKTIESLLSSNAEVYCIIKE